MKRALLEKAIFGMMLTVSILFNGCEIPANDQPVPEKLEGEWEGNDVAGTPVLIIIDSDTMTLESLMTKIKGPYEDRSRTIIFQATHIYDRDTNQFVDVKTYVEKAKKEYLDLLETSLENGFITQEEYEAERARIDELFPLPDEPETVPYKLEGNKLTITMANIGTVVLTRR
jgi:hypothetical protein